MKANRKRSFFKSITWRVLGTTDTFLLSLLIINYYSDDFHWQLASSIAFLELITKSFFYYYHERLWNRFEWGRSNRISRIRSFIKVLTWRLLATIDTFILSMIITSEITWAVSIAIFEILTKSIIYYFHERIWNKFEWGRY